MEALLETIQGIGNCWVQTQRSKKMYYLDKKSRSVSYGNSVYLVEENSFWKALSFLQDQKLINDEGIIYMLDFLFNKTKKIAREEF